MLIPITDADSILLDLRYASVDDRLGRAIGPAPKLTHAFRPLEAHRLFWHAAPDETSVAAPCTGATHQRGIAVDPTLVDAASGLNLPMGTGIDGSSARSGHSP